MAVSSSMALLYLIVPSFYIQKIVNTAATAVPLCKQMVVEV